MAPPFPSAATLEPDQSVSDVKMSSIRGNGYCSGFSTGFTVTLKSPQMHTAPVFLIMGTMAVSQLDQLTLERMVSSSIHWSFAPILGQMA